MFLFKSLQGSRTSRLAWIEPGTDRKILENTSNVGCNVTCESLDRLVCICGEIPNSWNKGILEPKCRTWQCGKWGWNPECIHHASSLANPHQNGCWSIFTQGLLLPLVSLVLELQNKLVDWYVMIHGFPSSQELFQGSLAVHALFEPHSSTILLHHFCQWRTLAQQGSDVEVSSSPFPCHTGFKLGSCYWRTIGFDKQCGRSNC